MNSEEEKEFNQFMIKNYERVFLPFVDEIIEETKISSGTIVDFGCGIGLLAKAFAEKNKRIHVIGIDSSFGMLREASKICRNFKNIEFVRTDVGNVDLERGIADIVVCKDSFHEFTNPQKALSEMLRIVKPSGWVFLQDLRRDMPLRYLRMALPRKTIFQRLQYYSARGSYTMGEVKKLVSNMKVRKFSIITHNVTSKVRKGYLHIDPRDLRVGFQTRYVAKLRPEKH